MISFHQKPKGVLTSLLSICSQLKDISLPEKEPNIIIFMFSLEELHSAMIIDSSSVLDA
jgi:hypothetical protein